MEQDDRRKSIRVPLQLKIRVVKEGKEYTGTAMNISADGISLATTHKFEQNELIEILFPVSDQHEVKLTARVVWEHRIQEDGQSDSTMGMEFEELTPEDQDALMEFVNQLLAS